MGVCIYVRTSGDSKNSIGSCARPDEWVRWSRRPHPEARTRVRTDAIGTAMNTVTTQQLRAHVMGCNFCLPVNRIFLERVLREHALCKCSLLPRTRFPSWRSRSRNASRDPCPPTKSSEVQEKDRSDQAPRTVLKCKALTIYYLIFLKPAWVQVYFSYLA